MTLLELHYSGLKSIFNHLEYQKMFLSGFFCAKKKHMRKRSIIWQKPWTNTIAKCRFFFYFARTSLFKSKKLSLLSRISKNVSFWLFLFKKKNIWEKGRFFDKTDGLTSEENFGFFFDFVRTSLLRSKKLFFLCKISKNVSFLLFAQKNIYKKKVDFLTKTMD